MRVLGVDRRRATWAREYIAVRLAIAQYVALGALIAVVVLLGGAGRAHAAVAFACAGYALVYAGVLCVLPASPKLIKLFPFGSLMFALDAVAAIAATGGAHSPARILLVFSVVYGAYYYETRPALLIIGGILVANALPLVYDARAFEAEPLGTTLVLTAVIVITAALTIASRRELSQLRDRARHEAKRDPLTELANRRALIARLGRATGGERASDRLGLVYIDLDGFKQINTVFGHAGGDAALKIAAGALRRVVRSDDMVARIGGDEFAIVAPGITGDDLRVLAQRAVDAVRAAGAGEGAPRADGVALGASAGTAVWPDDAADADGVLRAADLAMLAAKDAGGGTVVTAADDHRAQAQQLA